MRIVIDLQACQTSSRDRGIGRLSLALARAMVSVGRQHEFWILLSDHFADTIEPVAARFDSAIPRDRIKVFHQTPRKPSPWQFLKRCSTVSTYPTRTEVLAAIRPDAIHIASLFDEDVESPVRDRGIPTAVTLYDLIPLVHTDRYFRPHGVYWYHAKPPELKHADLLLAISEYSRREAINHLGIEASRIVTIGGGIDEIFRPLLLSPDKEQSLRRRLGLNRPFIMYTANMEWRKNISRLMTAFAMLPAELRSANQLAIVCVVTKNYLKKLRKEARALGLAPTDIIFTGFVSDEDLVQLYNLCQLFVFPSLHEGFGLPVGEAMACGAPVIGSNTTAIPEVIGRKDALFDPTEPKAITDAMARVLTDDDFRRDLRRYGREQAQRFTWEESARRALAALETLSAVTSRATEAG